jgi:capsule polysaccharide export protein KpsE/RkpR
MRLTKRLKRDIVNFAEGSIYRLNAKTSNCYAFSLYRNDKGKIDFQGGFDWYKSLIDKTATDLYLFETKTFIKVK